MVSDGIGLKICISGKGGVGKTTIAGTMARVLARRGLDVLAIDADPNYNLHTSIGIPDEVASGLVPLAEMGDLIRRRTGAEPYSPGGIFKANPKVSDLPSKLAITGPDGVRFVLLGTVRTAGSGCTCPANVLLRSFLRTVLAKEDHVVVDMEAGIEHLGRGTARYADLLLIVVEPTSPSVSTAKRIISLAGELGLERALVGNKVRKPSDEEFLKGQLMGLDTLQMIPHDECVVEAQMEGKALLDHHPGCRAAVAIEDLTEALINRGASS